MIEKTEIIYKCIIIDSDGYCLYTIKTKMYAQMRDCEDQIIHFLTVTLRAALSGVQARKMTVQNSCHWYKL